MKLVALALLALTSQHDPPRAHAVADVTQLCAEDRGVARQFDGLVICRDEGGVLWIVRVGARA